MFQAFNRRIGAWVKYRVLKNGKSRIMNVKQASPKVPFKGIRRK